MKNIVKYKALHYLVSTENTFDRGWETMIFETTQTGNVDKVDKIDFKKVNFMDLYVEYHLREHDAFDRHHMIVKEIKKYL